MVIVNLANESIIDITNELLDSNARGLGFFSSAEMMEYDEYLSLID